MFILFHLPIFTELVFIGKGYYTKYKTKKAIKKAKKVILNKSPLSNEKQVFKLCGTGMLKILGKNR